MLFDQSVRFALAIGAGFGQHGFGIGSEVFDEAFGGKREIAHQALDRVGADAVLAASVFHDGVYSIAEVKAAMSASGVEVRPPSAEAGT